MPTNWIVKTKDEIKNIVSTEIIDYQVVYLQEWGDFAFYHPTYLPLHSGYDSYLINEVDYNIAESYILTPPDKNYDEPGRWLKNGDITLNYISPQGIRLENGYYYNIEIPRIVPYKIGQKCNVIVRDKPSESDEPDEPEYKGYPVDILLVWQCVKLLPQELFIKDEEGYYPMDLGLPIQTYGVTWWLQYAKPVISFVNAKATVGDVPLGGLLWTRSDRNYLYINTKQSHGVNDAWNQVTLTGGAS